MNGWVAFCVWAGIAVCLAVLELADHWLISPSAEAELPVLIAVDVVRLPRDRCFRCRLRRVLYRVRLGEKALTEARCSECWGIREGAA
jgi:hypothetical protein